MTTATAESVSPQAARAADAQSMMVASGPGTVAARPADDSLGLLGALIDNNAWNRMVKVAETFSKSDLVPTHFQGKMANCIIALQLAIRMQTDPLMLMQNMYIVHGRPGIEAKFAIALANQKRVFRGPIRFELSGEGAQRKCTAFAIDRETGDRLEETVSMEMAKREGWMEKAGSKWRSIPDLMLKYRSAMWLIRTTCPEVLMGMQSADELEDIEPAPAAARVIDARSASDKLADILEGGSEAEPVAEHSIDELTPLEDDVPLPEQPADEEVHGQSQQQEEQGPNPYAIGEQEEPTGYVTRIKKAINTTLDMAVIEQIEIGVSASEPMLDAAHRDAIGRGLTKRREQIKSS